MHKLKSFKKKRPEKPAEQESAPNGASKAFLSPPTLPSSPPAYTVRHGSDSTQGSNFEAVLEHRRKDPGNMDTLAALRRPSVSPRTGRSATAVQQNHSLGLHLVYRPEKPAPVDIIFVHGLGGHFQKTWSKNHDLDMFWPGLWLPYEQDISKARIFSFGYPADFRPGSGRSISNISDFSKTLLHEMAFGIDETGQNFKIGTVPIVFVVHSMGGLVVKKAYLLSQLDKSYKAIGKCISAIIFLATPHRGSGLADILQRVLAACLQGPKQFINELNKGSFALEELNESFRHVAPNLSIWSFYETLPTKIASNRMIVVDKESSILGYNNEISSALMADHHDVCKYSSPNDSNYVSVRNAIRSVFGRFKMRGMNAIRESASKNTADLTALIGKFQDPDDDLRSIRKLWTPGTCDWALKESQIVQWLAEPSESCILWYTASPGNGKSVLASYLINHIQELGLDCQFYFFRFLDQSKRTPSGCLRSIAYQLARLSPEFSAILQELASEGVHLERADASVIWYRLFESYFFNMDLQHPVYWIIDALDEAESPHTLLHLFRSISQSNTFIRILCTSRKTEILSREFDNLSDSLAVSIIEKFGIDHNEQDINALIAKAIKNLRGNDSFKRGIMTKIQRQARGNFLWVRLVLDDLVRCHTDEDVEETLNEIPGDMTELYQRMDQAIMTQRTGTRRLARTLFQWTICAHRALSLQELSRALPHVLDIRRTIQDVCGQFIFIDDSGYVSVVHETARDYLTRVSTTEIAVDVRQGHEELAAKTVEALLDPELRELLVQRRNLVQETEPFAIYAATSWTYHLRHNNLASKQALDLALKFLKSPATLVWIHALALVGRLDILVKGAKVFNMIVKAKRKQNSKTNPMLHRLEDLDLLEQWSTDLVKIVGKFGKQLLLIPWAVYDVIPCICPTGSMIYRCFYRNDQASITITGNAMPSWDDSVARLILPNGDKCWMIRASPAVLATLGSSSKIHLWSATTFAEVSSVDPSESIFAFCLNKKGNRLATYGVTSTKLWSLPSGELLGTANNVSDVKAMDLSFSADGSTILAVTDDKIVRSVDRERMDQGWQFLHDAAAKDVSCSGIEDAIASSPRSIVFNADASQFGTSYRHFPLSVYSVKDSRLIGRLKRSNDSVVVSAAVSKGWFGVDNFVWNPVTGHILGAYKDGCLFKWHPITNEVIETQSLSSAADELAMSPDGQYFLTSDSGGAVTVWSFTFMSRIYRLSSSDLVTNLAFAADSRRFFDVRGRTVNVWGPNSLIRFSEGSESPSDTNSEDSPTTSDTQLSEAHVSEFESITALAVAPTGTLYCAGNEDGVAEAHDTVSGRSEEMVSFFNFQCISNIAWGKEKRLAIADLCGEIKIIELRNITDRNLDIVSTQTPKINTAENGLRQLLLNEVMLQLLVISSDFAQVWSLSDQKVIKSKAFPGCGERRWLQHPSTADYLISFGPREAKIHRWQDLSEVQEFSFREARPRLNSQEAILEQDELESNTELTHSGKSHVTRAMATQDEKRILVQVRTISNTGNVIKQVFVFDNSELEYVENEGVEVIHYHHIPHDILQEQIDIPLGVISGNRLVFLDQDLWLCTLNLFGHQGEEALRRHFFIPRDWATTEALELCSLMSDGTLLCPRNDRVNAITADLDFPKL